MRPQMARAARRANRTVKASKWTNPIANQLQGDSSRRAATRANSVASVSRCVCGALLCREPHEDHQFSAEDSHILEPQ